MTRDSGPQIPRANCSVDQPRLFLVVQSISRATHASFTLANGLFKRRPVVARAPRRDLNLPLEGRRALPLTVGPLTSGSESRRRRRLVATGPP
jgi:hypothetical protein